MGKKNCIDFVSGYGKRLPIQLGYLAGSLEQPTIDQVFLAGNLDEVL